MYKTSRGNVSAKIDLSTKCCGKVHTRFNIYLLFIICIFAGVRIFWEKYIDWRKEESLNEDTALVKLCCWSYQQPYSQNRWCHSFCDGSHLG